MVETSRSKIITDILRESPFIESVKWNLSDKKAIVYLKKEISEEIKNNIKMLLNSISNQYEVCFTVSKKKNFLKRFLEKMFYFFKKKEA